MSTNDPLKDWQLEGQGESPQQWKLQDAEQDLNKHMQLQPGEIGPQWQPVEYQREAQPRRRNWVLPSIVIVALLAVLGYVGWILLGQMGSGGSGPVDVNAIFSGLGVAPEASPTVAPVVEAPATPTSAPPTAAVTPVVPPAAATVIEATATAAPEPTPTVALVDLITGTVNAVAGVNARKEPLTTADVVTLLNQNEKLTVAKEENGWLQVILPDGVTVAWVSAEFVDQVKQPVTLDVLNALLVAAGLPAIAAPPAASPIAGPITGTVPGPEKPPVPLVVTVLGDPGINARRTPALDGTVVQSVGVSTTLTAIGRTSDGAWVAVQLPDDGGRAWVLASFVSVAGDLTTLSPLEPTALVPATAALTGTVPLSATTSPTVTTVVTPGVPPLVSNGVVPPAPFTNTLSAIGPALTISDVTGVNVRSAPSTDATALLVAPNGALLPVVGQSADGAWLQVSLPDGQVGWMFAAAVIASLDIAGVPVTDGADVITTVPVTPTVAAPAGPTAKATVVNQLGANLRSAPSRDLDPVVTVGAGETLTAIGRTTDGEWVQLALSDGTLAWAIAATVSLDADLNTLPVAQP